MDNKEYFLGLDMGTNSVGWAVTNPQYELLKAKGKDLWGIREFERAENSSQRRNYRVNRRNRQRTQVRIGLLKSYFEETIMKEDCNFFIRLYNSFYKNDDKDSRLDTPYSIFADKDYTDKEYYQEYPTIFHLKNDLILDKVQADSRYARKVYLALLNYFKRRGHFLNEGLSGQIDKIVDIGTYLEKLNSVCEDTLGVSLYKDNNMLSEIKNFLESNSVNMSKTQRRDELMIITGIVKKNTNQYLILCAICGLKIDLAKLFGTEKKMEIDFSSADFEEKLPDIYSAISDEYVTLVDAMKEMYDVIALSNILSGTDDKGNPIQWLSQARLATYDKHKKDLKILKKCIRKYCDENEYNYLFRSDNDESYSAYIGSFNSDIKKRRGKNLSKSKAVERYDKLRKRIKNDLSKHGDDKNVSYILSELDKETFLPKQLTFANGVIPNQLYEREVRQILKNASKYLPFLNEIDDTGLSIQGKIIRLFTFNVPYFVGPLSQKYKGNGWAVRKEGMENETIYPWNIEEVVDFNATNKQFVLRMVRECTYISGEHALPKESMEYQAYMVLNTINNIKVKQK
jgi:CRISPR-associated endonuclease Csn1